MTILVVGKSQPKSKRVLCSGCRQVLEYLAEDVRQEGDGCCYVDCPEKKCRHANYLGTR